MKKLLEYLKSDWVIASLHDRPTGTEVHRITFCKQYHYWLVVGLLAVGFIVKYWP